MSPDGINFTENIRLRVDGSVIFPRESDTLYWEDEGSKKCLG